MRSALLLALVLPACASLVPSTVTRLAALDPLSADPGDIAVSIILPPGLAVTPGSARLELAATRGDKTISGSYALMDRPAIPGATAAEGAEAVIYELTETDAARMRELQARIARWKAEGDARGSLGLAIGGCAKGGGPAADARGSVFIRLAPDAPFLPLIRDGRLSDLLGREGMATIQPCAGAG